MPGQDELNPILETEHGNDGTGEIELRRYALYEYDCRFYGWLNFRWDDGSS